MVAPSAGADYAAWIMLVPVERRREMEEAVKAHPLDTFEDLTAFGRLVQGFIIRGMITPTISVELRQWAELQYTAIAARSGGGQQSDIAAIITAAASAAKEARAKPRTLTVYEDLTEADTTSERPRVKLSAGGE